MADAEAERRETMVRAFVDHPVETIEIVGHPLRTLRRPEDDARVRDESGVGGLAEFVGRVNDGHAGDPPVQGQRDHLVGHRIACDEAVTPELPHVAGLHATGLAGRLRALIIVDGRARAAALRLEQIVKPKVRKQPRHLSVDGAENRAEPVGELTCDGGVVQRDVQRSLPGRRQVDDHHVGIDLPERRERLHALVAADDVAGPLVDDHRLDGTELGDGRTKPRERFLADLPGVVVRWHEVSYPARLDAVRRQLYRRGHRHTPAIRSRDTPTRPSRPGAIAVMSMGSSS